MVFARVSDGWIAGLVGGHVALISNPAEVMKTRRQLCGEAIGARSVPAAVRTKDVYRAEGLNGFMKGVRPSFLFSATVYATSFHALKNVGYVGLARPNKGDSFSLKSSLILASCVAAPTALVSSPLNLVKIRMQSNMEGVGRSKTGFLHLNSGGTLHLLGNVYQTECGPRALFRAAWSNYVKFTALATLAIYSFVRTDNAVADCGVVSECWRPLVASAVSGSMAGLVASPLDLISTRLYNQGVTRYGGDIRYTGYKDCVYQIISKEGLGGLYKGFGSSSVLLAVQASAMLYLWNRAGILYQTPPL